MADILLIIIYLNYAFCVQNNCDVSFYIVVNKMDDYYCVLYKTIYNYYFASSDALSMIKETAARLAVLSK